MATNLLRTGNKGFDDILNGGLPANRLYLIQGDPGVGKTTLALQFLMEGAEQGERVLYMTLSETREELEAVAESHGWSLAKLSLFELNAAEQGLHIDEQNTLIHPAEIELQEIVGTLLAEIERIKPVRLVLDSLSEVRLLAQDPLRFRRQILQLKQFFAGRACTVLLLDDRTATDSSHLESLAHGVVELEQLSPLYGAERRRVRIQKLRGVKFRGGYHDFTIKHGGIKIYPRLVAAEHREPVTGGVIRTGVAGLDDLLGGGFDQGTSTLLVGPAGTGKSSIAAKIAVTAAQQGYSAAIFAFDENIGTLKQRTAALGIPMQAMLDAGAITLQQFDPAEVSPGEFAATVREAVETREVKVVVIDTLNGYMNAMPEEHFLAIQMHELVSFLNQRGVMSILVMAQHGFLGAGVTTPVDVSYLSDAVLLLRYFEAAGKVRKAISVVKKRSGKHETTIREYTLDQGGLQVGKPLTEFQGVLTGVPHYFGQPTTLMGLTTDDSGS